MLLHLSRSLYYNINSFNILTWYNGIILLCLVSVISYLGYVLAWGQISYWGATVILNLLHPLLVYLISGNYYITVICLRRFFIFHFILPFILLVFFIVHVYYLHDLGSSNPVSSTSPLLTNMMLFVIVKDIHIVINLFSFIFLTWDSFLLSHPDNLIYPDPLKTPIHIIPEWYFLSYYSLLKIIPSKNIGFMTMILVFLIFIALGDVYITPLTIYKPLLFFVFYLYIYLLWIGAQYPVPTYIYYGRVAYILLGISVLILTTPAAKVSHSRFLNIFNYHTNTQDSQRYIYLTTTQTLKILKDIYLTTTVIYSIYLSTIYRSLTYHPIPSCILFSLIFSSSASLLISP